MNKISEEVNKLGSLYIWHAGFDQGVDELITGNPIALRKAKIVYKLGLTFEHIIVSLRLSCSLFSSNRHFV